mmetsp:Transcript_4499/g.6074  ORF Transcript_4499/g.6074 Transcript_4499/m.6074 type:complete len:377 (-) Transcript_4499:446-1576(-)|eukprot:CAMPEP_0196579766 /NCGR_PEP_ID=MMETSP1081-20130531/24636_1 /TAXON_ID=36882 /ORGANISM="Pyramimonas amylifera, Strain CCMP720" /LENGTH=376 /DNA_ID=CAMNT_0041899445 /DNA_START=191 /DNA_END=1321 /DNA_ORIENTATION=+
MAEGTASDSTWETKLNDWEFNVLDYKVLMEGNPLAQVGYAILKKHDLISRLKLPEVQLCNFLRSVESQYDKKNPYHCSAHACDALVNAHFFLTAGFERCFSAVDILAVCIAAIGHDVGHFSLNNAFLCNSNHDIVREFGLRSSLENFHLSKLLEILAEEDNNFLRPLSKQERTEFDELVEALVLGTDMGRHKDHFTDFQDWCADGRAQCTSGTPEEEGVQSTSGEGSTPLENGKTNGEVEEKRYAPWVNARMKNLHFKDRKLLLIMIIKCADLSNVVKPLPVANTWAERIMEEFYAQGELEIKEGLPLTQLSSRENKEWRLATHQLSFLSNVVHPLFAAFMQLADHHSRETVLGHAQYNTDEWTRLSVELDPNSGL